MNYSRIYHTELPEITTVYSVIVSLLQANARREYLMYVGIW